jgi:hypothetical protein
MELLQVELSLSWRRGFKLFPSHLNQIFWELLSPAVFTVMYCKIFGSLPSTIVNIFKQDLLQDSVEKFHEILCEE